MKSRKVLLLVLTLVLAIGMLTACASNTQVNTVGTSPNGSEIAIEKATLKFMKDTLAGGYQIVSTEELNTWVADKKDMIIIDTMPADSYSKGFVPGALNAELPKDGMANATDEQKAAFINLLGTDKDQTIVVYCGFVGCARSDVGAVLAMEQGFKNVYRVPGGIIAWQEAGYTVEK